MFKWMLYSIFACILLFDLEFTSVNADAPSSEPFALKDFRIASPLRDRNTMLLAHFDSTMSNDADYARNHPQEVGIQNDASAPGRFGGGVAVTGANGYVMFAGLDNIAMQHGTVEFWARSRGETSIWNDGKTRWFFLAYPERAGFAPAHGMAPYHLGLFKSADNHLVLRVLQRAVPRYALGTQLANTEGWQVRVPVTSIGQKDWHHVLISYDLRPPGRLWLLVDGKGTTSAIDLGSDAPRPNPGYEMIFGGISSLPGDNVLTSDCDLDELHVRSTTVAEDLRAATDAKQQVDEARLLELEDVVRASLDKLISLQRHGGWHDFYQWPTYEPAEWGWFGRGVNLWFTANADIGNVLLRGWRVWGDDRYLDAAMDLSRMFAETQFPMGGWNYHYAYTRGKYLPSSDRAYIAQSMQSNQIRFLTFLAGLTGDEQVRSIVRKAMEFHLQAQGPGGWWGWEAYPMNSHTGPYGHPALNDAVTPQAMQDLFVMYWLLRDSRCADAIYRAADWIIAAQLGPPTFGWADQYDEKNNPVWMRDFEPPAVSMQAISSVIPVLCMMYDWTGDDRYLSPLRKCLIWMEKVPEKERGWLWYDPVSQRAVVAYYKEMLPVDHPKAIKEIIPRLADHYGVKFPWQADRIREMLAARKSARLYPAFSGWKAREIFGTERLTVEHAAQSFRAGNVDQTLRSLRDWLAGKPSAPLITDSRDFGRQFHPMQAAQLTAQLLEQIELARVSLGDIPAESQPRFSASVWGAWVYAFPMVDLYDLPKP